MKTLVLRWTLWSSLLLVVSVAGFGTVRYLVPPEDRTPLEGLYRTAGFEEQDEATIPRVAPEAAAFEAGFPVQWPTMLPPGAVLSDTDVAARRRAGFRWTDASGSDDSPLLRLDQEPVERALPDRPEVTVHELPGRLGQVVCLELDVISKVSIERDCLGIWWIEDGVSIALTSPLLPASELLRIAESLRPLNLSRPIYYGRRTAVQIGGRRVSAGQVTEYPTPSVTYLANLKVYLVRSAVGFTALIDEDPHLLHPTAWDVARQRFNSPAHGEIYTWLGRCIQGPCPRGLDRFDVRAERDRVIVDTTTRFMQLKEPYWRRPTLYLAPAWP